MNLLLSRDIPYTDSVQCLNTLDGIKAIDYFFAKRIIQALKARFAVKGMSFDNEKQKELVFHLMVALSQQQREGSICCNAKLLSNQHLWVNSAKINSAKINTDKINTDHISAKKIPTKNISIDKQNQDEALGYVFPNIDAIDKALSTIRRGFENQHYLVIKGFYLYTKRYWHYENYLCACIVKKLQHAQKLLADTSRTKQIIDVMDDLFVTPIVHENTPNMQQIATLFASLSRFSIITGGAGTGKTYTIARLLLLFYRVDKFTVGEIELLAPTGKAANRVYQSFQQELTQLRAQPCFADDCNKLAKIEAKTIHRVLKIDPVTGLAKHDEANKINARLVIVDESSMIDISLLVKLMQALHESTIVILVGDANQLPSIESGSLLADLVDHPQSKIFKRFWNTLAEFAPILKTIDDSFKQQLISDSEDSLGFVHKLSGSRRNNKDINTLAQSILDYDQDVFIQSLSLPSIQYISTHADNFETCLNRYISATVSQKFSRLSAAKKLEQAFELSKDFVLLTPFRQGVYGVDNINYVVESILIKTQSIKNQFLSASASVFKGKPIMVTKNDYNLGVYNGDIGIVWDNDEGHLCAFFEQEGEHYKQVLMHNLLHYEASYAMTIHKAQGSEFKHVAVVIPEHDNTFLSQQLLYTAVTRAKNQLDIVANKTQLLNIISNKTKRISGIQNALMQPSTAQHP